MFTSRRNFVEYVPILLLTMISLAILADVSHAQSGNQATPIDRIKAAKGFEADVEQVGGLLKPGPTHVNVMDLAIGLIG